MSLQKSSDRLSLSRKEEAFERQFLKRLESWNEQNFWPGVILCIVLTWLAWGVSRLPFYPFTVADGHHPISIAALALVFGIIAGNFLPSTIDFKSGTNIIISRVLPIGIVLLGARLDFYNLIRVGLSALMAALLTIGLVIVLTHLIARFMGVDDKLGLLIGTGTAICGTSAILVTAPIIEAEEEEVSCSTTYINLFGVATMVAFPILAALFEMESQIFGVWCGLSIHATPQVIAAGFAHYSDGQSAGEIATIVKLTRVSLLGPSVFVLGALYAIQRRKHEVFVKHQKLNYLKLIPTFVLFFMGMALLRTLGFFPEITLHMSDQFILGQHNYTIDLAGMIGEISQWLIAGALAAVGLNTELRTLRALGLKPFLLGLTSTILIGVVGLLLAKLAIATI